MDIILLGWVSAIGIASPLSQPVGYCEAKSDNFNFNLIDDIDDGIN